MEDLKIKARPDEELGDLILYLSQFDMKLEYNPGKYNLEADCLSRNPVLDPEDNQEEMLRTVNMISFEDIIQDQKSNDDLEKNKKNLIEKREYFLKR